MQQIGLILLVILFQSCSLLADMNGAHVFIHGAHFDGSSWKETAQIVTGKKQIILTLPGRDEDKKVDLYDLATYSCRKIPYVSTLIVHSQGGAVVNQMMGICPDKMKEIVYVSAVVPFPGEKAYDYLEKRDEKWYFFAVDYKKPAFVPKDMKKFRKAFAQDYRGSSFPKVYSEPSLIGEVPLKFVQATFNEIPKYYIMTTKDLIVTPETQRKYIKRSGFIKVFKLDSGHLPMLTRPRELAELITSL